MLNNCGIQSIKGDSSVSFDEYYTTCPVCGHVQKKKQNPEVCQGCKAIFTWIGDSLPNDSVRPIYHKAIVVKALQGDL